MPSHERLLGHPYRIPSFCAVLLLTLLPGLAHAQKSASAVTHVEEADEDFTLQGEFVGAITSEPSEPQTLALQIRASGDGTFEAAQYMGTFPGGKAHRGETVRLTGKRTDDYAVLSGGPWIVLAHADYCVLVDPEGQRVGRMQRVHRQSPTMGAQPPEDAVVLFDGTNTDAFIKAEMTDDGLLMQGADVKPMFQDFNLHAEFMLPYMPVSRKQGRANSGLYLQSRYEVQVLDSFAIDPGNNGCGSLYKFRAPDVNVCFPPLTWQTYDIVFTAPRWAADGTKLKNARTTVWHNGFKVHNDVELANKTGAGKPEEPSLLPIRFQDHGNPVRFRNIWAIDRGATPPAKFPAIRKADDKKANDKKADDKKADDKKVDGEKAK